MRALPIVNRLRDIAKRLRAGTARRVSAPPETGQERLDLVVRAALVGIVDWDGHTHATYYSPRLKEMLGHPPEADTSGWPDYFKVLIHPEDRARVTKRWREFILDRSKGSGRTYYSPEEYRMLRADGSYVWVQVSGVAVRDATGFVTRWIAAVTDITERRARDEALRQSVRLREEVERMSRHDLKTPLNSVIAVSRLLREGGRLPPEDDELLNIVERAGYRILNMVNLSLDLFRMEQGSYQFRPQAIDLGDVARKAAADLESLAASKNVALRILGGPAVAHAEELLCYSMLANLLKNAIEASPEGRAVTVTLDGGGPWVRASVHNAGPVPEALRERFFDKYVSTGKSGGLGLGTYSAQLMARIQGGELTMRTSEAEGTTLEARLAAAPQGAAASAAGKMADGTGSVRPGTELPAMRVLVVDDDEFNRLVLRRYLPAPPLTLRMAVNGRAALDAALERWPDLVFLDLEMPIMDGYEAAARLREIEARDARKRLLIVAISSNDDETTVARALAAGCDHYLVKPASREALRRVLVAAASGQAPVAEAPARREARADDPVQIDADLQAELPEFLATRRAMLDDLLASLDAGSREAARRHAHRLSGSFALYGFRWAAAQCGALMRDAAQGDLAGLAARARAVRQHLDSVEVRVVHGATPPASP